ncbi:NAD(P)-dependent oxidoreductase [uncultured Bacteroides sp.]|uniref:NAD-dependent epimerase/dehydratase family protein n=1 Tax=uncultured Bacteroides sp. TaxID=162156 RepID=UPI002AA8CD17|nr:NAD(P)-dependent oxidoreductase [uncultured Bacteroides sp.]
MKGSVLVTGASGFIGNFIIKEAIKKGYDVWAGVRATSKLEGLQDKNINLIELDFAHPGTLKVQLSDFKETNSKWDYIIHTAGVTKCSDKKDFDKVNYQGTKNFVDALSQLGMVPGKFIYLSSLSVFGPIHERKLLPITDDDKPRPNTAYGISKLRAEEYIRSLPDFPYLIYRPTGVYGPREKDYFLMVKSIQKHVDFAAGLRKQLLTFVYVADLAQAIFLGMEKDVCQKSYFVSDGKVYKSRDFSDLIKKELGNPFVIHLKCPLIILKVISLCAEFVASYSGKSSTLNADKYKIMKQRNWQCDITPLIDDLGYNPQYHLEKGVKQAIDWYKKEGWL